MAVVLSELFEEVRRALDDPDLLDTFLADLPDVDVHNPSLEDLFRWGDAVAEAGRMTPELADALVRVARKYAHRR